MTECLKCKKKLGLLSSRHKFSDNSIMCNSCFEEWNIQAAEKNKKIVLEYISKYISNKDKEGHLLGYIAALYRNKEIKSLFDKYSLERVRNRYQSNLDIAESSNKSGLSSYDVDEIVDTTDTCERVLDFLEDLEKMYKLIQNKNIEIDYLELLSFFAEIIENKIDKVYDKILIPSYKRISKRLGKNITKENIIKEFMRIPLKMEKSEYTTELISKLLNKFNLEYEQDEVEQLIEDAKDEVDLEEFEQDLGSSQKIDIGDFTKLNGYDFEEYLKNLFKYLGYAVIKTSLSGDQGADLIMTKGGEKIVVQAKKYSEKVSNKAIQEISAAKNHYKADKAIVVTNSSFTKSAIELALTNNVELWDGIKLKDAIKSLKSKTKEKELSSQQILTIKEGENIREIKGLCPFCEENVIWTFPQEIKGGLNLEIKCPNCDATASVSTKTSSRYYICDYCSKRFDTKEEEEEHEKSCIKRKK